MWIDLPLTISPYYEITVMVQLVTLYYIGVGYFCFDNLLCVMNLHLATQFQMLQYKMSRMTDFTNKEKGETNPQLFSRSSAKKCYTVFKKYIQQHQALIAYCRKLESVFNLPVLAQVLAFSLVMCLDGYQILMPGAPSRTRFIFSFQLIACLCQLLMFTYSCDCIMQESASIALAVYKGPWSFLPATESGMMIRKDMILVTIRSGVPCCITAYGFFVVSLETYTRNQDREERIVMHTERYTDISIKISRLLLKIAGIWKSANKTEDRQRKFGVFYTMITSAYSMYVNVADICHNLNDLDRCIFLAANVLNTILAIFKISMITFYKTEFSYIIVYAQKHFWHLNYDLDEKILFAECKKVCKLWSLFVILVIQIIVSFYAVAPICANIGNNGSERTLPVAMWVDLPVYVTPYYEIMFVIQLASVQQICVAYMACDNFLCILNMHVICQFRMLHNRLFNLWKIIDQQTDKIDYADKCYAALKQCIRQHQSLIKFCEKLECVYRLPIFGHIVIFSLLMCFDTYEILLADVSAGTRLIFVFHIIGSFIHIIFFTYTCHGLIEESSNISLATYSGRWTTLPMTKTGRMLREDAKMMIMKSTRPCYLTAGGFFPVSLETSTALMSTTMSYYTLIRESSLKMKTE
ncbi:uncharacterized protein [Bombus fervidus]|uniref:uncharacterized protein n=1 Tax=Bombus fervidus TaxID=203811 RepID=UPI003AB5DA37